MIIFVIKSPKLGNIIKKLKKERKAMVNFRTDLASERRDIYKKANQIEDEIQGIESEKEEINDNLSVERVKITNQEGEKQ